MKLTSIEQKFFMAKTKIQTLIANLRQRIEDDHKEFAHEIGNEWIFKYIDEFINSADNSELEKAFYLLLHQFPGDHKNYIVHPREMILVPDVYDMSKPGFEYEIDFAIYGGSIDNPLKVAIECDGIRSHRQKHSNKDRRKDVNLQAAGWLVMRFGSNEIHEELQKFETDNTYISSFLYSIENTISQKLRLIDHHSFTNTEFRSKLTGYKWDWVTCTNCNQSQMDKLNHKTIFCRHCKTKFKRIIQPEENIEYDHDGILFFKN